MYTALLACSALSSRDRKFIEQELWLISFRVSRLLLLGRGWSFYPPSFFFIVSFSVYPSLFSLLSIPRGQKEELYTRWNVNFLTVVTVFSVSVRGRCFGVNLNNPAKSSRGCWPEVAVWLEIIFYSRCLIAYFRSVLLSIVYPMFNPFKSFKLKYFLQFLPVYWTSCYLIYDRCLSSITNYCCGFATCFFFPFSERSRGTVLEKREKWVIEALCFIIEVISLNKIPSLFCVWLFRPVCVHIFKWMKDRNAELLPLFAEPARWHT